MGCYTSKRNEAYYNTYANNVINKKDYVNNKDICDISNEYRNTNNYDSYNSDIDKLHNASNLLFYNDLKNDDDIDNKLNNITQPILDIDNYFSNHSTKEFKEKHNNTTNNSNLLTSFSKYNNHSFINSKIIFKTDKNTIEKTKNTKNTDNTVINNSLNHSLTNRHTIKQSKIEKHKPKYDNLFNALNYKKLNKQETNYYNIEIEIISLEMKKSYTDKTFHEFFPIIEIQLRNKQLKIKDFIKKKIYNVLDNNNVNNDKKALNININPNNDIYFIKKLISILDEQKEDNSSVHRNTIKNTYNITDNNYDNEKEIEIDYDFNIGIMRKDLNTFSYEDLDVNYNSDIEIIEFRILNSKEVIDYSGFNTVDDENNRSNNEFFAETTLPLFYLNQGQFDFTNYFSIPIKDIATQNKIGSINLLLNIKFTGFEVSKAQERLLNKFFSYSNNIDINSHRNRYDKNDNCNNSTLLYYIPYKTLKLSFINSLNTQNMKSKFINFFLNKQLEYSRVSCLELNEYNKEFLLNNFLNYEEIIQGNYFIIKDTISNYLSDLSLRELQDYLVIEKDGYSLINQVKYYIFFYIMIDLITSFVEFE